MAFTKNFSSTLSLSAMFFPLIVGISPLAYGAKDATSTQQVEEKIERKIVRFTLNTDFLTVTREDKRLSGVGLAAGIQGAVASDWGICGALRQSFSPTSLVNLFTEVELGVIYAITGSMRMSSGEYQVAGRKVASFGDYDTGGWRAQLVATQYYFNAPTFSVPFSGIGAAVIYDFPSETWYGFRAGLRIDKIGNGQISLMPMQLFGGAMVWL